jgi:Nuclease-related domain
MILAALTPIFIILSATGIMFVVLQLYRQSQKDRKNPLTRELLRSPGESLRMQVEDLSSEIFFYSMLLFIVPVLMYSIYLSERLNGLKTSFFFVAIFSIITLLFCIYKLWRMLTLRTNLVLGLDCELAIGQELNQLMLHDCMVYHDFPAEKFNIDHVVVGPRGVFAVETKGRSKRDKKGTAEATVTFDGEVLKFPSGPERKYLDQAKRQASWLSSWLSSATGDSISVQPILALPGWFIERKKPTDIIVFNGKNPDLLLKWCRDDTLSEPAIKRIIHQIDQRCRDVAPAAYKK